MRSGGRFRRRLGSGPLWALALICFLGLSTGSFAQVGNDLESHYRRAQEAMAVRDYGTAAAAWKAVIELAPDMPQARSNLGLVYHLQQDYGSAINQFRRALSQDPQLLASRVFLGISYYLTSRPDHAIRELERARAMDPNRAMARKWLAMSYVQTEQLASAIEELRACRRIDPEDHDLVFHLGRVYRKISDRAFRALRQAGFESAWLFLLRGQQFITQDDTRSALDEFQHAVRLDPRLPGIHYEMARVHEKDERTREALLEYARELQNHPAHLLSAAGLVRLLDKLGLHEEATAVRERALRFHQGAPEAVEALASSATGSGANVRLGTEEVERIRDVIPALQPRPGRSWISQSRDALLAGQPARALQLTEVQRPGVTDDMKRYWRARAFLDQGQAERALAILITSHADDPDNVETAFFLQACAERLALKSLEAYASLEPASYRSHQLRAEYHASLGETERAIAEYSLALRLAPRATQLHLAVGSLYMNQRKYPEALAAFQAELKNDAYSVAARARMGEAHYVLGNVAEADKILKEAIAINASTPEPHKTLGQVYFKRRNYRKSVEHFELALRLGLDDEDLYYHLGRSFRMLGNLEEAEKNLAIDRQLKESRRSIAQERLEASQEKSAGADRD